MTEQKWPLAMVRWIDSSAPHRGWASIRDFRDLDYELDVLSVGFVVRDEDEHIALVPHTTLPLSDEGEAQGTLCIPKAAIIEKVLLRVPGRMMTFRKQPFTPSGVT